jgi:hypothetical protein
MGVNHASFISNDLDRLIEKLASHSFPFAKKVVTLLSFLSGISNLATGWHFEIQKRGELSFVKTGRNDGSLKASQYGNIRWTRVQIARKYQLVFTPTSPTKDITPSLKLSGVLPHEEFWSCTVLSYR